MANGSDQSNCYKRCWLIGLAAGVVLWLILMLFGTGVFKALLIGILGFVIVSVALIFLMCMGSSGAGAGVPAQPDTQPDTRPDEPPSEPASALSDVPSDDTKPSAQAAVEDISGTVAATDTDAPADQTGAEAQPGTLAEPRSGGADDLKRLKGVGPKLEQTLNELGFFHFDQIAEWTPEDVEWVDARLKFKGRIERDGWIEQAKTLAAGGETEFSKRKKS